MILESGSPPLSYHSLAMLILILWPIYVLVCHTLEVSASVKLDKRDDKVNTHRFIVQQQVRIKLVLGLAGGALSPRRLLSYLLIHLEDRFGCERRISTVCSVLLLRIGAWVVVDARA